jgi:hypothetical protein
VPRAANHQSVKRAYLVLYEYGQGGVWAYILARSSQVIRKRFPQLEINRDPPEWMTAADIDQIKEKVTIDIDDESNPILASLRQTSEE